MKPGRSLIHLEDLIGRRAIGIDGAVVGRIEEVRAERRGDEHEVTEYLLGPGALLERWSITRRLFGRDARMRVARWDQLDISRPDRPRLTCAVEDLKTERPQVR